MPIKQRPLALIILDGWGYRTDEEANAIAAANTPNWDSILKRYPYTLISGSGRCVGLPEGQMGNSEVGHLNMGAGRIVNQDLTQIDEDIANGQFFKNPVLTQTINRAIENQKAIHILGLLSPGGVHSHEKQIFALLDLAAKQGANKVYIHAFLDGRDTPPRSAHQSLENLIEHCEKIQCGKIASMIGRYYAMDRDKRWDRVQKAYDLLTMGIADYHVSDALTGLQLAYGFGDSDEFIKPTTIHGPDEKPITIENGDTVIFMNFRADRARELTHAFIDKDFDGFARSTHPHLAQFVTLTEYDPTFKTAVAYPPERLTHILGEYLSELGLRQLRIAETEKYAHVTFFFNGGIEKPYPGEDRILIPSSKVATYDLHPEMSAYEITKRLITEIQSKKYDVIICNFANPDMVGHTGNFDATVKAIETIDNCLGKIVPALEAVGGEAIITADHGNAEYMFDKTTGQAHTAHTSDPVPFVYVGRPAVISEAHGTLSDVAPTMLYLMGLEKPAEMTGKTLLSLSP
ncbi:MAG: 2,3-bisphosphoglycerate-independent phosphoglycerate mutase [Gammaproteobacteria bacterium]|nr:2,3-bisphosphoglycerate-independent phosphoglycerate mutase [Gammaproteobacteria bacterium]